MKHKFKSNDMLNTKFTKNIVLGSVIAFWAFTGCDSGTTQGNAELTNTVDSVSYSLGYQNGNFLANRGMEDINPQAMMAGLRDALQEEDSRLTDAEMMAVVQKYQVTAQQKQQEQQLKDAKENQEKGEAFLAENKNKEGVKVTESGLQYKVLKEGTGESPGATDTVTVHYEGTLIDGTVFDSSYELGKPATFPLDQVIAGWTEGVQLMKEGATYKFFIPADLAYGMNPRPGGPIGPNETLIFKVELLEVK
jgi:FKBP-type peptidyl-prolyl cis-trans isomerase